MTVTKEEKEKHVIDLYEQGKNYRYIAKQVHMSLGDISRAIKRHNGKNDKKENPTSPSKDTKALILFTQNKTPLVVVTELGLSEAKVDRIYPYFLKLIGYEKRYNVYDEVMKDNNTTSSLLEFYKIIKEKGTSE